MTTPSQPTRKEKEKISERSHESEGEAPEVESANPTKRGAEKNDAAALPEDGE